MRQGYLCAILNKVVRGGLSEKVIFLQRSEGVKGENYAIFWKKMTLSRGDIKYRSPQSEKCLECLGNSRQA